MNQTAVAFGALLSLVPAGWPSTIVRTSPSAELCRSQQTTRDPRYPSHWWRAEVDPQKPAWEILPQEAAAGEVILSKRHELRASSGQTSCVGEDDIRKMLAQVKSSQVASFNKELQDTLLKLKQKSQEHFEQTIAENRKDKALMNRMRALREKNTAELCPILRQYGWPSVGLIGPDGVAAAFFLLKNSSSFELQRDLLPVIVAVTQKGEIDRADFAGYVDQLRLRVGLKQLFGTQATIKDGFLVLYPIEAEALVNAKRRQYHLPPLSEYLKSLQRMYRIPLVKSPPTSRVSAADARANHDGSDLLAPGSTEGDDVIRVETSLVSLDVNVYSKKLRTYVGNLEQKDFKVFEDGHEEAITFFWTTHVPFDLVLLIDLSGSTRGKREVIRKSIQHFIEAARPSDRLAIVTFSDTATVVAPLMEDRAKLLESVKEIDGTGGSRVWDALKFTLDQVVGPKTVERRKAIVFMTDGADNALLWGGVGSRISFADLLEVVRRNDTLIAPIYLDTEGDDRLSRIVYENARKTLARLAGESGGPYYKARKIEDLNGVYQQVINDLGKVYSLGYKPTNAKRDNSWRTIQIQILNRPDLVPRVRAGYYAK